MSLLSAIKSIGRAIDPTNAKAPLGSLVATAANVVVPGSGAALAAVGQANKSNTPAQPTPLSAAAPAAPSLTKRLSDFATSTTGMVVGLATAGLLLALLLFKRRK